MALRCAKFSSLDLLSLGSTDLFFSAHALLMMRSSVNWFRITGLGALSKISIVLLSTFTTLSKPCVYTPKLEVLLMARFSEKITSSASRGLPSLNLTPVRSLMRSCVGVTNFQSVANCGSILKVRLL